MPGSETPDWVANPVNVIDRIFENDLFAYQNDPSAFRVAVEEAFKARIAGDTGDYRYMVPLINGLTKEQLKSIPPNTLVRFRCMVKDERPATYHQNFLRIQEKDTGDIKVVCALFRDGISLKGDEILVPSGGPLNLSEVRSLTCAPLPGETAWLRNLNAEGNYLPKIVQAGPSEDVLPSLLVNFFLDAGKDLNVNDVIEAFGLIAVHQEISETTDESMEEGFAGSLSSTCEVRLNAVYHDVLSHCYPALPLDKKALISAIKEDGFSFVTVRAQLLEVLKFSLDGDELAAEYLLLHLISSVYARPDGQSIGNFPLNLTGVPQDVTFIKRLLLTLETIVTQIVTFSMSIASLNSTVMAPKMSVGTGTLDDQLLPGLLQLPRHTHLVVDELGMNTGTLNDTGCRSLIALQQLVNEQKLEFDFQFGQRVPFLMDIPVLLLSQQKSLVNCSCIVPLTPSASSSSSDLLTPIAEETAWNIRQYLVAALFLDYEITDEMREIIVQKFVDSRKIDRTISPESLHHQLELARYMTISYGENTLSKERWLRVLQLEESRQQRLKNGTGR